MFFSISKNNTTIKYGKYIKYTIITNISLSPFILVFYFNPAYIGCVVRVNFNYIIVLY